MKYVVFGSEGIGGSSICSEIQYEYPDAEIVRIDRKLGNDYECGNQNSTVFEFLRSIGLEPRDVVCVPLNTGKLSHFRDHQECFCTPVVIGNGNIDDFSVWGLWKNSDDSDIDVRFLPVSLGIIDSELYKNCKVNGLIDGVAKLLTWQKENRFCLKRKSGNGGRGFRVLTTEKSSYQNDLVNNKPGTERIYYRSFPFELIDDYSDFMFQEYCNGFLLSVDVLFNHNNDIVNILMRKRLEEVSGITTKCKREFDRGIYGFVESLGKAFKLTGIHGFQFKQAQSSDGMWKLIDWNPRLQSGIVFSRHLGSEIFRDVFENLSWVCGGVGSHEQQYYNWLDKTKGKVQAKRTFNAVEDIVC